MTAYEAAFTSADIDFIYQWSGGHPRHGWKARALLQAVLEAAEPTPLCTPWNGGNSIASWP